MVSVRRAIMQDYDGLSQVLEEVDALHREALPHIFRPPEIWPPRSRERIAGMIADDEIRVLVAEDGGQIVGVNIAKVEHAPDTPIHVPHRFIVIDTVAVGQAFQRQGIGTKLAERVFQWAKEQNVTRIELHVYECNQGAIAFYEKLGFETLSRRMEISL